MFPDNTNINNATEYLRGKSADCSPSKNQNSDGEQTISSRSPSRPNSSRNNDPFLVLIPNYRSETLLNYISEFISHRKIYEDGYLEGKLISLSAKLQQFNNRRGSNLNISYLEHSHYMYSFKSATDLNHEERERVKIREKEFSPFDYPDEKTYLFMVDLIKFVSRLMVKLKLFDVNHYGYRMKGRSLTVRLLDMQMVSKQCMTVDVLWFSFAIRHLPFHGKVDLILENYALILEHSINRIFEFMQQVKTPHRQNPELNEEIIDLEGVKFEVLPAWKKVCCKSTNRYVQTLYNCVESVEIAYRCFEKQLIQEFLKIA